MQYSSDDLAYIQRAASKSASRHITALREMLLKNVPYAELFAYGSGYLPHIKNEKTGKIELERLDGYVPEIVEFFDILSEIPSLPARLKDVATDLAIYANGESVQIDAYYLHLDPESEIKNALRDASRHV
jgi:hypothetical protein